MEPMATGTPPRPEVALRLDVEQTMQGGQLFNGLKLQPSGPGPMEAAYAGAETERETPNPSVNNHASDWYRLVSD